MLGSVEDFGGNADIDEDAAAEIYTPALDVVDGNWVVSVREKYELAEEPATLLECIERTEIISRAGEGASSTEMVIVEKIGVVSKTDEEISGIDENEAADITIVLDVI